MLGVGNIAQSVCKLHKRLQAAQAFASCTSVCSLLESLCRAGGRLVGYGDGNAVVIADSGAHGRNAFDHACDHGGTR